MSGRRVLAVLECRASDDAVLARAVDVAERSGGFLTVVVVAPRVSPWVSCGPYCAPRVTSEEMRAHAERVLARATGLVPRGIPLAAAIETGRPSRVIARRVEAAAHDLVVVRRRRLARRRPPRSASVPVLAVAH
jgi:hypothetical protein